VVSAILAHVARVLLRIGHVTLVQLLCRWHLEAVRATLLLCGVVPLPGCVGQEALASGVVAVEKGRAVVILQGAGFAGEAATVGSLVAAKGGAASKKKTASGIGGVSKRQRQRAAGLLSADAQR
jgi:hypothetical protein